MAARANSTGASVANLPVNVKTYGAVGDGTTTDTTAFTTAIATGRPVFVPPGTYKLTAQLTLAAGQGIFGVDPGSCWLEWHTDLGAGTWGIAQTNGVWGGLIRNLTLHGPGYFTTTAYGVKPANMHGIGMANGGQVEWVQVSGFNAGIAVYGDHEEVRFSRLGGNYYGIKWEASPATAGDQVLDSIQMDNNKMAGIGVAGSNSIGGVRFSSLHIGNCPYGIYGETPAGAGFLNGLIMDDCAFEGYHNGVFYAEPGGFGAASRGCYVTMRSCADASGFVSPVAGLTTAAGQVDVPGGVGINTDIWPFSIVSDTLIKSGQNGYVTYTDMTGALASAISSSKPISNLAGITPTRSQFGDCDVLMLHARPDLVTFSAHMVVGNYGSDSVRGLAAGNLPRGVALTDPHGGQVPVAVSGVANVLSDDATLTGGSYYVKLDGTTGKVLKATGPTDGTVVGITTGNQGGGLVAVRLQGFS